MFKQFAAITAVALTSLSVGPARAAGIGPVVSTVNEWNIHRSVDSFTDQTQCTAVNNDNKAQIADDGKLYISMRGKGGLKMSRVRYNNSAPHSWRLYDYKDSDIFVLNPAQWQNDQRVRIEIYTVLRTIKQFDFNIPNAKSAYSAVLNCQA